MALRRRGRLAAGGGAPEYLARHSVKPQTAVRYTLASGRVLNAARLAGLPLSSVAAVDAAVARAIGLYYAAGGHINEARGLLYGAA